ncbi:hypothetical protein WA588_006362 [Blastocystis sp. NMH]
MAFLAKSTVQNLVKSRNVVVPVVSRAFSFRTLKTEPHTDNRQHSDAQWRLSQTPVIEVSEPIIICDGGMRCCGPLGHPMQYLRMNGPNGGVNRCQYCGQRYKYVPKH